MDGGSIGFQTPKGDSYSGIKKLQNQSPILANAPVSLPNADANIDNQVPQLALDNAHVQVHQSFNAPVQLFKMPEVAPLNQEQVKEFCSKNADAIPTSIARIGDKFVMDFGNDSGKVTIDGAMLAKVVKNGNVSADSALLKAMCVYETALDAGLKPSAAVHVVNAFRHSIENGQSLSRAMANARTAIGVEAYATPKDGLAQDLDQLTKLADTIHFEGIPNDVMTGFVAHLNTNYSHFSPEFKAGMAEHEVSHLASSLEGLQLLVNKARATGDYTAANHAMKSFFPASAHLIGTPYWQGRQQNVSVNLDLDSQKPIGFSGYRVGGLSAAAVEASPMDAPHLQIEPLDKPDNASYVSFLSKDMLGSNDSPFKFDKEVASDDWNQFTKFAKDLRQQWQVDKKPIVLNLQAHGEEAGFILGQGGYKGKGSITSVAWINKQLADAGFKKGEVIIVAESCNGGTAFLNARNHVAQEHIPDSKADQITVVDVDKNHQPHAEADFTWIGRPSMNNVQSNTLLQYVAEYGQADGEIQLGGNIAPHNRKPLEELVPKNDENYVKDFKEIADKVSKVESFVTIKRMPTHPSDLFTVGHAEMKDSAKLIRLNEATQADVHYSNNSMAIGKTTRQKLVEVALKNVPHIAPPKKVEPVLQQMVKDIKDRNMTMNLSADPLTIEGNDLPFSGSIDAKWKSDHSTLSADVVIPLMPGSMFGMVPGLLPHELQQMITKDSSLEVSVTLRLKPQVADQILQEMENGDRLQQVKLNGQRAITDINNYEVVEVRAVKGNDVVYPQK